MSQTITVKAKLLPTKRSESGVVQQRQYKKQSLLATPNRNSSPTFQIFCQENLKGFFSFPD
ncbi:hypothetical protein [Bacillus mycoides]|uniref:hypothetical protein n=1 Tax=Bacillus mycoides TaxID=1405 RepID=UPI0038304970